MSVTTVRFSLAICVREIELISSVWNTFFEMAVNPKVFGSERADEPQTLETERSLLQADYMMPHSATTS